jgi:hypothetical protein
MSDNLEKVAPSSGVEAFEPGLGRLLQPTRFFRHPRDVVRDATLTIAEKRAILSSWASDASAIESVPALRQMPGSDWVVRFDDVIDALQELDEKPDDQDGRGIEGSQRGHRGGGPEEGPTGSGNWF